jgi:hypothetical protein
METIVHIALKSDSNAKLTPLELLEDFADASPDWHYLEDESTHYAEAKGVSACVLRHRREGSPPYIDFAFASTDAGPLTDIELLILDPPDPDLSLDLAERNNVINAFLQEMQEYLNARPGHATLRVEKDDIPQEQAKNVV